METINVNYFTVSVLIESAKDFLNFFFIFKNKKLFHKNFLILEMNCNIPLAPFEGGIFLECPFNEVIIKKPTI